MPAANQLIESAIVGQSSHLDHAVDLPPAVLETDVGARRGEVVERLGIELSERLSAEPIANMARGRGVTGRPAQTGLYKLIFTIC